MNELHIDHQVASLAFANALSFCLEEDEGIMAQGETEPGEIHKLLVWKHDGKIRVASGDEVNKKPGTRFRIWDTLEDSIISAALDGGEYSISG